MILQHNITSMNANRQLGIVGNNLSKATEKLSSGYRVNRAADDAAGLAISEKMRAQIRGLNRASDNAQDGISLIQTAEGAMEQQHAILQRTRELLVQASNSGTLEAMKENDFQKIQDEIDTLKAEYERINTDTEFNRKTLLDGTYKDQYLQVGANAKQGIKVTINTTAWDKELYLTKDAGADDEEEENATIATKTLNGVEYSEDADGKFVSGGGDDLDTLLTAFADAKQGLADNDDNDSANAFKTAAEALGYTITAAEATNATTKNALKAELNALDPTADITEGTKPKEADEAEAAEKIYNPLIFTERAADEGDAAGGKTKTVNDIVFTENEDGKFVNEDGDDLDELVAALGKYDAANGDTDTDNQAAVAAAQKLGYTVTDATDTTATATEIQAAAAEAGAVEAEAPKGEKSFDVDGEAISKLLNNIDTMIKSVTTERSNLGALQNRLEYTVKVDDNTAENLQSAESRIRDTDMADEMTRFSKESILQQAATSMLAQANQANQGVLSLLQ